MVERMSMIISYLFWCITCHTFFIYAVNGLFSFLSNVMTLSMSGCPSQSGAIFLLSTKCISASGKLFFSVLHNAIARIESPICLNRIIRILLIGFMLKLLYAFYRANITKKKHLCLNINEKKKEKTIKVTVTVLICGESQPIFVRKEKNIVGIWPNFFIFAQSL